MERTIKPATALREHVRYYVHIERHLPGRMIIQPVPARTAPAIEFTFGEPYEIMLGKPSPRELAHAVAVIGSQTYPRVRLTMQGHVDNFIIVFQPGGLSRLFSIPLDALTDLHFEGRAVLGRSIDTLASRLGDSHSFEERACHADQELLRRCPAKTSRTDVTAIARKLLTRHGCLQVSALAECSGISVRQFQRRFVSQIGVSPKLYARIARFEAALKSKRQSPGIRWTDVAQELGYHDQMHMVRDFHDFSESTPSLAISRLDLFVAP